MSLQLANNWHFASLEVYTSPMSCHNGVTKRQDLEVALAEARSKISQLQELSIAKSHEIPHGTRLKGTNRDDFTKGKGERFWIELEHV